MGLSKSQQAIWERSRVVGAGAQAVVLDDSACTCLIAIIAADLGVTEQFPELPKVASYFELSPEDVATPHPDPRALFERLVSLDADADTYYACLASLHKARLKYHNILSTQPVPTLEQVGPRGLLQYGAMSPRALAGLIFWRKWFFDIDNRAGQETGYLFEPIIAHAIGGTPVPSRKSPIKRHRDQKKGRQVDCVLEKKAYEFKIRVTIAASGQGRWREELDFPIDCKSSGYTPVLIVLDGTRNPKLDELERAFLDANGDIYTGSTAWEHLDSLAGMTMSRFLDTYVRGPIDRLIQEAPVALPSFSASVDGETIRISIGDESLKIDRVADNMADVDEALPDDIADNLPGS
ncbi:MAG: hypothetical protein KDA89_08550 [Planctomycetaceae bacterium]|nr:hypothetical protein [Planctomycetaceae bacterium]